MSFKDLSSLNKALQELEGNNKPSEIFIDNLHCPYVRFHETFILPQSSITNPSFASKAAFTKIIMDFLPEAISGTFLLPEARPKKEVGKLFFVRPILFQSKQFLYIFSVDLHYLGGSLAEETKIPASQDLGPSVETDRIYFHCKVIPIETVQEMKGSVTDFAPLRFRGGVFEWTSERDPNKPIRRYSEIFDEMDFSELESKIKEDLEINSRIWNLGKIYNPIGIDYLALSLRFLHPSVAMIVRELKNFYQVLDPGEDGVEKKAMQSFHSYLARHQTERTVSRTGNILWKIHFTDKAEREL